MISSDEIREIQRIIMGFFRQARCYHNGPEMHYYRTCHSFFHGVLADTLMVELWARDLERWCEG